MSDDRKLTPSEREYIDRVTKEMADAGDLLGAALLAESLRRQPGAFENECRCYHGEDGWERQGCPEHRLEANDADDT